MAERLVIVGADAGGMGAASQVQRLRPDLEIVAFDRGHWTSYSACGIPYLVGGEVASVEHLVARSPQEHRRRGIDVRLRSAVTGIDLDRREVEARDLDTGTSTRVGFDLLLVATGGSPLRPPLPGIDEPFVHGVQTLDDATHLVDHMEQDRCRRVVVVGGGYIGLEMAEAFVRRGLDVALVDRADEVMGSLDPDLGARVRSALVEHGVDVRVATDVLGFRPGHVETSAGDLPADLVVLGIGVAPNSELAGQAGLALGVKGSVRVDDGQRAGRAGRSHEGVWAAGDCCESRHLVTGQPVHIALGTVANKQARVAGIVMGGGEARFPGVLGTAVSKICRLEVARTGLHQGEAAAAGLDVAVSTIDSTTLAGYLPGAEPITVRLVAERGSGRVVGGQIVGGPGAAKRIDVVATAITARFTVQEVLDLDLAYAPPFSGVWDPVAVAAREALKLV